VPKIRKYHAGWWTVQSPDGRKFTLEAEAVGVPGPYPGLGIILYLIGWLYHWIRRRGWRVTVTEVRPWRESIWQWIPPPSFSWQTAELANKNSALIELQRLAELIHEGVWPRP
jgi:hypothetical protein